MSHPINDLIIRLKNGYGAGKAQIASPYSVFREEVLKKLKALGYIRDYAISGDKVKAITIDLRYEEGVPALTDVRIYSTTGRRWYTTANELRAVRGGMGYSIISTPKGIMTHIEAKKQRHGGELLFSIW